MKRKSEPCEMLSISEVKKMSLLNTIEDENERSYKKVVCIYSILRDKGRKVKEDDIEKFVKIEGDINYRIPEGSYKVPSLLHAVFDRRMGEPADVPKMLLNYGADFTFKDNTGRTVVHKIIQYHDLFDRVRSHRIFHDDYMNAILEAHVKFNNPVNPCDENGISHFHAACMTNNAVAVEFFLKNGVDVGLAINSNSPFFPPYTPIQLAVKYTCPDVIEILLKYGADMYVKNAKGLTPLHTIVQRAVSYCDITETLRFVKTLDILVKFVIDNGIDKVNATDDFGFSKLHVACLLEDQALVENILNEVTNVDQTVNLDSPVCAGFTALHFAAFSNVRIFKLLLARGANIRAKNVEGLTPFDFCLQNYSVSDIHTVLSSIQEWRDIVLSDNETKLLDVVSALERADEFISFLDSTAFASRLSIPSDSTLWPGYTLLHLAVVFTKKNLDSRKEKHNFFYRKEGTKIIDECLKRGADVTRADVKGSTALHLAFYMKKRCVIHRILDHCDTIVNPVDEGNLSHFHIACATRHLKGVERFLSNAADLNSRVTSKFHWYTRLKYTNIKTGSRHFTICPGSTPLHIAVACGDFFATEALLKKGADVHAKDINGLTPIHRLFACRDYRASAKIQKYLLAVKNLKNVTIDCGFSHLHVACFYNQCAAVEELLKDGANYEERIRYTYSSDYDEFFCDKRERYHEHLYFSSEFDGYTPLDFLWHQRRRQDEFNRKSFWKISFMLIERCADTFEKTDKGISQLKSLLRYIDGYHYDCLYEILSKSINTQTRLEEEFGVTKLHLACYLGDVTAVENAIKHEENVNAKVYSESPVWQGFTPLHFVVTRAKSFLKTSCKCQVFVKSEYLKKKKNLNEMKKMIGLLMKHGADPFLMDDNNETPFHVTKRFPSGNLSESYHWDLVVKCVSTLFKNTKKFDVNPSDNQGLSVFHIACLTHNVNAVRQFLDHGVDVNRATSDFSKFSRGSTPLHLFMEYYDLYYNSSSVQDSCDDKLLRIADMLISSGADVTSTDVFGKTLLFSAVELRRSRRVMMEKLISNGVDVHATHTCTNITAFELLLRQGTATYKEIELFLKAGYQLNAYNPNTQEGYIAQVFRYQQKDLLSIENTMKIEVFDRILNDPKINEIDSLGGTAIHNIVSIDNVLSLDDKGIRGAVSTSQEELAVRLKRAYLVSYSFYENFYAKVIERLMNQGCDINHQNNEGKTALHLAASFNNGKVIIPLLKMGADINVIDKNGKTALAYCTKAVKPSKGYQENPWRIIFNDPQKYRYNYLNYANKIFAVHVYKLEFCGEYVNDQNKVLQRETLDIFGPIDKAALTIFHEEVERTKNLNIGNLSLSLYDFLMKLDTYAIYINMTNEERQELELFFENIGQHKFHQIDDLLRLKYRQIIEKIKLMEPTVLSLNTLSKFVLPDLCCRYILKYLKNADLRHLIASVE